MNEANVLLTLIGGLASALVLGYLAKKINISPIVGYLLAGILIGPFTPGFTADYEIARQFSEIGVILLLFGIGLRFELKELFTVWTTALPGAIVQSTLTTILTVFLLHVLGWDWIPGMILGASISVASTVVMSLVLTENHDLHTPIGHISIGWTVVEDIMTVVLLLLLPILFGKNTVGSAGIGVVLGTAGIKIILLGVIIFLLGKWIIPWIFNRIERTGSYELFTLTTVVLAIGIAVVANAFFGVSIALGAFLAGLAVGRSDYAVRAAGEILPLKEVFSVLFFVSAGMLVNPLSIASAPLLTGIVLFVVVAVKPLLAAVVVRVLGQPFSSAIPIGAAFAQIGEFSFILGATARSLGLLDETGWNVLAIVSIISIALNPSVYKLASSISKKMNRAKAGVRGEFEAAAGSSHCIIVGYGPVGRIVHQILAEQSVEVTIVDLNLDTVRDLRNQGYTAIYGDAFRQGTLEQAGIAKAHTLVISTDIKDSAEIILRVKKINPLLKTIVRCSNLYEAIKIKKSGASIVAAGEAEVGVALAEAIVDKSLSGGFDAESRTALRSRLYEIIEPGETVSGIDSSLIFSKALQDGAIITRLESRKKEKVLRELVGKISVSSKIKNKDEFLKRIYERERVANTSLVPGFAVPHARTNVIDGIIAVLAVSQKGIDWDSSDGKPVHVIVLLGAHESLNDEYLRLLSKIASIFNDKEIVPRIRKCTTSSEIRAMVHEREKIVVDKLAQAAKEKSGE
jgi:monovalent cation:H+ antiporter-2, CPA2 family